MPVSEIPITALLLIVADPAAILLILRTVFPVIVFVPTDEMMPIVWPATVVFEYLLTRFAIVLFVITMVPVDVLTIPLIFWAVADVDSVGAMILPLTVGLPIVLLSIVHVPDVVDIPVKLCENVIAVPDTNTPPIELFVIETLEVGDADIPVHDAFVELASAIAPVRVVLPMIFPDITASPAVSVMPAHGTAFDVVIRKLVNVLF